MMVKCIIFILYLYIVFFTPIIARDDCCITVLDASEISTEAERSLLQALMMARTLISAVAVTGIDDGEDVNKCCHCYRH